MDRWNGRVALVTGASAGIGAAICRELVQYGLTVVGCARNVLRIKEMAEEEAVKDSPGQLHAVKCDLAQEPEILAMFNEIRSRYGRIDICINNAAFSTDSPLLSGESSDWRNILEVNVLSLCICTREAVKLMMEKRIDDGQIIHISSVGGHSMSEASSFHGLYFHCGTKFMIRALTEGMRREVKAANTHIRVGSISPGLVETEFVARTYGSETAKTMYSSAGCLQAKDVADAVVYILQSSPHVDVNDIILRPTDTPCT